MNNYVTIDVPNDLLPQVAGELLALARDANDVEIVHEVNGRVIHAHPVLAEAWYRAHVAPTPAPVFEPEPTSELVPTPAPAPAPEPSAAKPAPVAKAPAPAKATVAKAPQPSA